MMGCSDGVLASEAIPEMDRGCPGQPPSINEKFQTLKVTSTSLR